MFGEKVEGYSVPVLNEREIRAGAGILFFISLVVFLGAWHADHLLPAQLMIIGFFLDFLIRVFHPKYSPSLTLGRILVANQIPEYTAAAPKRFAWWIGLFLATLMVITLIFMHQMSYLNFGICGLCIFLLFLESSCGICLGCLVYHKLLKQDMTLCPGGVCEVQKKEEIQRVSGLQLMVMVLFAIVIYGLSLVMIQQNQLHQQHGTPNHPLIQELKGNKNLSPAHAH